MKKIKSLGAIIVNKITFIFLIAFLFIGIVLSYFILSKSESIAREQKVDVLENIISATHHNLSLYWDEHFKPELKTWSEDVKIIEAVKELSKVKNNKNLLVSSPSQKILRQFFLEPLVRHDALGMFIISPENINLASMRDTNIGEINLIHKYRPELLKKVFQGSSQLIPPMPSDVKLPDEKGNLIDEYPTMFLASPIKNKQGKVIAALTVRVDPLSELTKISKFGKSGETYLIDSDGRLLSESRYNEFLRKINLISKHQNSTFNLMLHDPGIDLTIYNYLPEMKNKSFTFSVEKIMKGESGSRNISYRDYRGVPVIGVWLWDESLNLGIVSEMDEAEALQSFYELRTLLIIILLTVILLSISLFVITNLIHRRTSSVIASREEYTRSIIDQAADSIITINDKGIVLSINVMAVEMFQYSPNEIIGRNINMLMPEPYSQEHDSYINNYIDTGNKKIIGTAREVEGKRKDGSIFPLRLAVGESETDGVRVFIGTLQDLSHIKEAEEALRISEDKYRHLFEDSWEAIILLDDNGIHDCNQAALNLFRVDNKDKFRSLHLSDLLFDETPDNNQIGILNTHIVNALKEGEEHFEIKCLRQDKNIFNADMRLSFIDFYNQPIMQLIALDITDRIVHENELQERKKELELSNVSLDKARLDAISMMEDANIEKIRAEKAFKELALLEKERLKLERAIEQSLSSIMITDIDGKIDYVNTNFIKKSGLSENEVKQKGLSYFVDGQISGGGYQELLENVLNGDSWLGEIETIKDDDSLWESISISPVRNSENIITHIIMFKDDITYRKLTEQALRLSETNLAEAQHIAHVGSWDWNIEENSFIWSDEMYRIWGLIDKLGSADYDLFLKQVHPDDKEYVEAEIKNTLENKKVLEIEFRLLLSNGITRYVYSGGQVYHDNGKAVRMVGITQDITERKETELEMELAKESAEAANKAKSEFLATMSHEIRTPMNAIIGMSYLALETDLNNKQHGYIQKVSDASKSLLRIINDILDFSKIEAGQFEIDEIHFEFNQLLQNLSSLSSFKAQEKGLEFLYDIDINIPKQFLGDPLRLNQILLNLVSNAIKFTESGEVIVSSHVLSTEEHRTQLQFSIKDTGIGISEEQQQKLFKKFSQADASTTRKYGGTGLGLVITKKLIEMMEGEIWVESEPGLGTTFNFNIWLKNSDTNQSAEIVNVERSYFAGKKALVVDDQQSVRVLFKEMLEDIGFSVNVFASAGEAIKDIEIEDKKCSPYDVVLIDWKMPDITGIEATRIIQQQLDLNFSQPAIIMATGYNVEHELENASDIHLASILYKPFSSSDLYNSISSSIEKNDTHKNIKNIQADKKNNGNQIPAGMHILVVEDNSINQEIIQELLHTENIITTIANNGLEAIELVNSLSFNCVLMDMQMPEMDGIEATQEIRKFKDLKELPIIALTANAMRGDREKVIAAGMNDYVSKPIDIDELFTTLIKWLPQNETENTSVDNDKVAHANVVDFPEISGIDVEEGLRNLNYKTSQYRNLLMKFSSRNRNFISEFNEVLVNDYEVAFRMMHSLSGLSGSLRITNVYLQSAILEKQMVKKKKNITSAVNKLEKELNNVIIEIDNTFVDISKPNTTMASIDIDHSQDDFIVKKLTKLLKNYSAESIDYIDEHEQALIHILEFGGYTIFRNAVEKYDFEKALEILNNLETNNG